VEIPTTEEIIIDQFYKLAEGFLSEYKRANDLRALEFTLQIMKEKAAAEDHSVEFEELEGLVQELILCGK